MKNDPLCATKNPDYVHFNANEARHRRNTHEDIDMFNNSTKSKASWFPGMTQAQDRWGNPVGAEIKAREYRGQSDASSAAARLRWSLGHA